MAARWAAGLTAVVVAMGGLAAAQPAGPFRPSLAEAAGLHSVRAESATLIMVEERGCIYCLRWDRDVGGGYARTAEGRAAPLRRVRRDADLLRDLAPVVYTPTFILVRDGRELGRITGYPGQLYFWEELSHMMATAGIGTRG